ncbi:unnamed protein product [Rhizoctonia solani]|uniref:F-box-like n=1 Tax=Rhizoctonia solani TaxID=456999 RepID=A0A8H7LGR1_9AGAM|nr:F-box-like [Rhizoctonia solani]CAE6469096.1 unnamed protein product [Rhizoctonia solani]
MDASLHQSPMNRQARESENRQQPVNSLPPEVLSNIFLLCEYAIRPSRYVRMRGTTTRGDFNLFCQTTLPAVSHYWREVALDTPGLWTRVTLADRPPFHLSALYLSRSGEAPLDVEIRMTDKHWGYSNPWIPEVHQALPFIVAQGGVTSRWRNCWIQTNDLPAHLATLKFLTLSHLPILEYLELDYRGPEYTSRRFESGVYSNFTSGGSLFCDSPNSRLRVAVLRSIPNICLFRHLDSSRLTELTYLELGFCSPLPKLEQLNELLVACPRLTSLFLDSMLESHFGDDPLPPEEPMELRGVHLPTLQSLALKYTIRASTHWELGLLKMIDAPHVKSFQLYLASNSASEADSIINYIANKDTATNSGPMFPLLTSFGFFAQWDITSDLRKILSTHPNITTLILPEFPELTALLETPWLVPSLALLSLEVREYEVLKKLLVSRRSACLPLKTVELKRHTTVWVIPPEEQRGLEELVDLVFVDELEDRMFSMLKIDERL